MITPMSKITCAAQVEKLVDIEQFVDACLTFFQLDAKKTFRLHVAVEEVFVNICNYAYPGETGEVSMSTGIEDDALVLEISDHGIPFNRNIEDRHIGGLGAYFICQLTDEVSYRREDGKNILKLVMRRIS